MYTTRKIQDFSKFKILRVIGFDFIKRRKTQWAIKKVEGCLNRRKVLEVKKFDSFFKALWFSIWNNFEPPEKIKN